MGITTNSVLSNYSLVAGEGGSVVKHQSFAITCLVSMSTPGVKLLCRPSYEMVSGIVGSPFDYPLSSRFDENDAICIFDNVLVPWENILIYGDTHKYNCYMRDSGMYHRGGLQACTRLAVKLESRAFQASGLYVMRADGAYCLASCGTVGDTGIGYHKHNDLLSFELYAGGQDCIVDPGAYVYTRDPAWRNRFRSTAAHNTVVIDASAPCALRFPAGSRQAARRRHVGLASGGAGLEKRVCFVYPLKVYGEILTNKHGSVSDTVSSRGPGA